MLFFIVSTCLHFCRFWKARGMRRLFLLCVTMGEDGVRTTHLTLETDTHLIYAYLGSNGQGKVLERAVRE